MGSLRKARRITRGGASYKGGLLPKGAGGTGAEDARNARARLSTVGPAARAPAYRRVALTRDAGVLVGSAEREGDGAVGRDCPGSARSATTGARVAARAVDARGEVAFAAKGAGRGPLNADRGAVERAPDGAGLGRPR
jgi:hypothetical protein